uniref:Superoxide dismutase 3, extracellular a n=1 Tax=Sinocyclocheilus grahami TaxID=75366 RepID=A0A672P153_SINGR
RTVMCALTGTISLNCTSIKNTTLLKLHDFTDSTLHSSQGCVTAGPHYNPREVDHPGHPGDLGNFVSEQGVIRRFQMLPEAKLFGGQSVLGRAVVVHEKEDDLGMGSDEESKRSGNAGKRIAGCVIGAEEIMHCVLD